MSFTQIRAAILDVLGNKRGAAMVEYALLAGLVAVVAAGTLSTLGTNISGKFTAISTAL